MLIAKAQWIAKRLTLRDCTPASRGCAPPTAQRAGVTAAGFSRRLAMKLTVAGLALTALPAFAADRVKIRDLWAGGGQFSPLAEKMAGAVIELQGYMAPPLKPEIDFFVLTRIPMAFCPYCDTEAAWPDDLILVFIDQAISPVPFNDLIRVSGRLEIGTKTDAATGFVSRARLLGAAFERV